MNLEEGTIQTIVKGQERVGAQLTDEEREAVQKRIEKPSASERNSRRMMDQLKHAGEDLGLDELLEDEITEAISASSQEHQAVAAVKVLVDQNDRLRHQNNHLMAENAKLRRVVMALTESATTTPIPGL